MEEKINLHESLFKPYRKKHSKVAIKYLANKPCLGKHEICGQKHSVYHLQTMPLNISAQFSVSTQLAYKNKTSNIEFSYYEHDACKILNIVLTAGFV